MRGAAQQIVPRDFEFTLSLSKGGGGLIADDHDLAQLRQAGFLLIVVTNQPDVARGTQRRERVEAINDALKHALPIDEPTPNEVKQAVCGNGAADKGQVATMVQRLLNVSLPGAADDATDALAAAIGCLYRAAAEPRPAILPAPAR